jgi:hypothetical protein
VHNTPLRVLRYTPPAAIDVNECIQFHDTGHIVVDRWRRTELNQFLENQHQISKKKKKKTIFK